MVETKQSLKGIIQVYKNKLNDYEKKNSLLELKIKNFKYQTTSHIYLGVISVELIFTILFYIGLIRNPILEMGAFAMGHTIMYIIYCYTRGFKKW